MAGRLRKHSNDFHGCIHLDKGGRHHRRARFPSLAARGHGLDFTEAPWHAGAQPEGLSPVTVHVVRVQVRVEGPDDWPERVADPVAQVLTISGPEPEAARRPAPPSHGVAKSGRA
jgi:hypothetical protein